MSKPDNSIEPDGFEDLHFEPEEIETAGGETLRSRRVPRWLVPVMFGLSALLLGVILATQVQLPYYAFSPGPVGEPADLAVIEEQATYPLNGNLYLLTVSLREVSPFEFLQGWLSKEVDLYEKEVIRPPGITREEQRERNRQANQDSREVAAAVALRQLGYTVGEEGQGVLVVDIIPGTPAEGALEPGDVIVSIGEKVVSTHHDLIRLVAEFEIGQNIALTVERGQEQLEQNLVLAAHPSQLNRPIVGIVPATRQPHFILPFPVSIDSENVGGPSAGIMYTLAVMDLLTEEDLLKGNVVAGTGTIDRRGNVGAIGGVRQKVVAAQDAGAQYILVPEANLADAVTVKEEGVEIFGVSSLQDALEVLERLPASESI